MTFWTAEVRLGKFGRPSGHCLCTRPIHFRQEHEQRPFSDLARGDREFHGAPGRDFEQCKQAMPEYVRSGNVNVACYEVANLIEQEKRMQEAES